MSGKRRKYTPEFREQAARLVIETGRPVAHVAAEIGVGEQVLGRWVRLSRDAAAAGDTGAVLDADERAELERLRRPYGPGPKSSSRAGIAEGLAFESDRPRNDWVMPGTRL